MLKLKDYIMLERTFVFKNNGFGNKIMSPKLRNSVSYNNDKTLITKGILPLVVKMIIVHHELLLQK